MSAPGRLHPDDLDAIADRVAERLIARLGAVAPVEAAPALLTAAEVARRFDVTAGWVRENADRLGVIRLGDGPKPRLRFDAKKVAAALTSRDASKRSVPEDSRRALEKRRPRATRSGNGPGILPVFTVKSGKSDK